MVNGRRITLVSVLKSGDEIMVGGCRMKFVQANPVVVPNTQDDASVTLAYFTTRKVVVFVMDVGDYTRLAEVSSAEELTKLAGKWSKGLGAIIERHGGTMDQIIGDVVMALWMEK